MASGHEGRETALEDVLQALCARGRDVLLGSLQAPVAGDQGSGGGVGDVAAQAALASARLACQALRDFIDGSITSVTLRLGEATEALLDLGPPPLHRWPLASKVMLGMAPDEWLDDTRAAQLLPRLFSHVPLVDRRRITALEVSSARIWFSADGAEAMAQAIRELPALQRVWLWPELPRVPGEQRPLVEALASLRELNDLTLRMGLGPDLLPLLRTDRLRRLDLRITSGGSISVAVAASLRCMIGLEELTLRGPNNMASVVAAVAALPPSLSTLHFKDADLFGFDPQHCNSTPGRVTFELEDGGAVGLHAEYLRLGVLEELRQHCGAFLQPLRCIRVTGELVFGWDWDHQHRPYLPLDDDDLDPDPAASAEGDGSPEARMLEHLLRQHELTLEAQAVLIVSAVIPLDQVWELLSRLAGMETLGLALQVVNHSHTWEPPEVEHKLSIGISTGAQAAATCWPMQTQEGGASVAGGSPAGGGEVQVGAASAPAPDLSLYDLAVEQLRAEAAEDCSGSAAPPTPYLTPLPGRTKERIYTTAFVQCINMAAQRVMDGWGPAADWTGRQRLGWLLEQWVALRIEVEEPKDYGDIDKPDYGDGWSTDSYGMSD
ncbi:hypothetical protein GPECTOR_95g671 [Gonium pectorale]|uniref:Uncharacterized protein n=1 Tax=Gonium pectorale TaxID=33097 RepID=A0A150G0A8_GONPE|nr:hypothetical protein GPECTOR_95g671 [Gonium pectorale]|eukprot:KXZ43282.1 hypothetical protein GPECTOR_95g671 [Gonium pectorale]